MAKFISPRVLVALVVSFALAWASQVNSEISEEVKQVKLNCKDSVCVVEFQVEDNEMHTVELVKEEFSIFGDSSVVSTTDGDDTPVKGRSLQGIRYHTRPQKENNFWATALISNDNSELIEGVFSTAKHGIIELNKNQVKSSYNRRRTSDTGIDEVFELPGGRPWILKSAADVSKNRMSASSEQMVADETGLFRFFPNCFPQDSIPHVLEINIVFDYGLYQSLTQGVAGDENAKRSHILADLEAKMAIAKLALLSQLNIRLVVKKIVLGKSTDPVPLSQGGATCNNAIGAMDEMMSWVRQANSQDPTAYWMLVSNCFSQVTGVSYLGSACGTVSNGGVAVYSWLVILHELGHGLGMSHSFEDGIGITGGVMDYSDGSYNGVVQFHPNKRTEVCPFLTYIKNANCPFFYAATAATECGDGVLDKDEACECLDGSKRCDKCVNCEITDPKVQCSSASFILRTPSSPDIVIVEAGALSSPECCMRNFLAPPKTLCGPGMRNVCTTGGACTAICSVFLSYENPNCGFDDSGCTLGCVHGNKCRFDLTYTDQVLGRRNIGALPDGSACVLPSGARGQCATSGCVPLVTSTAPPTKTGSTSESHSTDAPTLPVTRMPTIAPTRTPTNAPVNQAEVKRCKQFKAKKRCGNKKCQWCAGQGKGCYPIASVCPAQRK